MIKKFIIRGKSKKFKFTKLPSQPVDKLQAADKFRYDAKKKLYLLDDLILVVSLNKKQQLNLHEV